MGSSICAVQCTCKLIVRFFAMHGNDSIKRTLTFSRVLFFQSYVYRFVFVLHVCVKKLSSYSIVLNQGTAAAEISAYVRADLFNQTWFLTSLRKYSHAAIMR